MSVASRILEALSFVDFKLVRIQNNVDKTVSRRKSNRFDWRKAIVDGFIVAGVNFSATLVGIGVTQIITDPIKSLIAASISALYGFFMTLAAKRGLNRYVAR